MLTWLLTVSALGFFAVISWFLWKSGFLFQAEKPQPSVEIPITDARARAAFLKRLQRWKEEGKLTRDEHEHVLHLTEHDWK